MERIVLSIEKKISKKLNEFFKPLGYETPEYWFRFIQNNPTDVTTNSFIFEFDCFKNKYEIDIPIGESIFYFKTYAQIIRYNKIEIIIDEYVDKLKANGINTVNIGNSTIVIGRKKILELDTLPILKIENRNYLEVELDEFITLLIKQIKEVIFPYTSQFNDITFLDKKVNSFIRETGLLSIGDYGSNYLKKMLIAKLANNPLFEEIALAMKIRFEEDAKSDSPKYANDWVIARKLFEEMYERIRFVSPNSPDGT